MELRERLSARAARLLGGQLEHSEPLAGGDLSVVVRIGLRDGRQAIVKGGPAPPVEAGMLRAIRGAGVAAPGVLACDADALVLELLPDRGRLDEAWASLGSNLARLHAATGDRYGWEADYAFADLAIVNTRASSWPEFWGGQRLRNQIPHVPAAIARRLEALADDLPNRLPANPAPSLLHGDLWSGNVLVDGNEVSGLIDPACYYGHCEVDFAMLCLFSRPGPELFSAYGRLEAGYAERLPAYQLWPSLVHLRLFGAGYRPLVERLLTALGV